MGTGIDGRCFWGPKKERTSIPHQHRMVVFILQVARSGKLFSQAILKISLDFKQSILFLGKLCSSDDSSSRLFINVGGLGYHYWFNAGTLPKGDHFCQGYHLAG